MRNSEFWSGRAGFIFANIASALGLGSIWKFPFEVGTNGGAGFVLFYLIGLATIVFPLMLAEFAIGRRGKSDAALSITVVAREARASTNWRWVGVLGVVTGFLILSFYSVIGGWALAYVVETAQVGIDGAVAQARFDDLLASPARMTAFHAVFMVMTALIVARGIAGGIEQASKLLMPVLIALMVVLAAYAIIEGDLRSTLHFLFAVDFTKLNARVALEALGLGFFSIGVGLSVMITYAAYAGRQIRLFEAAIVTIITDTAASFLAGFAIFPVVFAEKLDPSSGPGLMFVTLPLAFARIPFGTIAAWAFFALVVVAALGSAISLLELVVALVRHALGLSRAVATALCAATCWMLGLGTVFSFNLWASWYPLAAFPGFAKATLFDLVDHLTSNLLLPIAGFLLALFAGWIIPTRLLGEELALRDQALAVIRLLLRYFVPFAIAAATIVPLVR